MYFKIHSQSKMLIMSLHTENSIHDKKVFPLHKNGMMIMHAVEIVVMFTFLHFFFSFGGKLKAATSK